MKKHCTQYNFMKRKRNTYKQGKALKANINAKKIPRQLFYNVASNSRCLNYISKV